MKGSEYWWCVPAAAATIDDVKFAQEAQARQGTGQMGESDCMPAHRCRLGARLGAPTGALSQLTVLLLPSRTANTQPPSHVRLLTGDR